MNTKPVPPLGRPTLEELRECKARTRLAVKGDREVITVGMGPQHPSTHGVFRAELDLVAGC